MTSLSRSRVLIYVASFLWFSAAGGVCFRSEAKGAEQLAAGPARQLRRIEAGRELFSRQWVPSDRRSKEGDGLGPVYNDRSCLNCHDQGGPGGSGAADKNIVLITPASSSLDLPGNAGFFYAFSFNYGPGGFEYRLGNPGKQNRAALRVAAPGLAELVQIHPGFRSAPSVVLHRYGNDPDYRTWREWVLGKHGALSFKTSQRNPPAIFGVRLIDTMPDDVIEAGVRRKHPGWPGVKGRVSRLADGRIGRFGWKAQTATLREFVLSAAAVELGLEVPGHAQAADPRIPPLPASGPDMDQEDVDSLIAYVRALPRPATEAPPIAREARAVSAGKVVFKSIGCATCHTPKLGDVEGIYSDLLLHEMSPELSDTGVYGAFLAGRPAAVGAPAPPLGLGPRPNRPSARLEEWRTPPLWGLRDSAPYLHDGRAATIEEAILLHGGEASASAQRYRQLIPRDRAQLERFLITLVAPSAEKPAELARNGH
jgi:CxxC motif-containing protein (DUF1111 family)